MNVTKISKGYYEATDKHGTTWVIQHATIRAGYTHDEWHVGTESDPHADQHNTKRECLEAIEGMTSNS